MLSNPSLAWQKLLNVYYSIYPCYDKLEWDIDNLHANHKIAISENTTLIALASNSTPHPSVIKIYSITGAYLWSVIYNSSSENPIIDFCFHGEHLCVILAHHGARVYTDFQNTYYECPYDELVITLADSSSKEFLPNRDDSSLGNKLQLILEATVMGDFLVLRYASRLVFLDLTTQLSPVAYEVPCPDLRPSQIHSLCLLNVSSTTVECLISYEKTVFKLDANFSESSFLLVDESLTDGPFTLVSASSNGALACLFNPTTQKIFVITKALDKILLEYDTSNESSSPFMVKWAGDDAIVMSLRDEIKLIGPGQESISFFYDIIDQDDFNLERFANDSIDMESLFTVPIIKSEPDGLRIITNGKVEFLSRVPESLVRLYLIGSSDPSVILLTCVDKLALQASKAYSNVSFLEEEGLLIDAITNCLDAALEELEPAWQQKILKAVSFGKIEEGGKFDAAKYLHVLNSLKVLNQLRSPEVGLFFTNTQVSKIGWPNVIQMLLDRSQHLMALTIALVLKLEALEKIYVHWCCAKIRREPNMTDPELFKIICDKLDTSETKVPISDISMVAYQEGRLDLCKLLVNLESSTLKSVSQLIALGKEEVSLTRSIRACDYDLSKLILLHFRDNTSMGVLNRVLNQNEIEQLVNEDIRLQLVASQQAHASGEDELFVSGDMVGVLWEKSVAVHHKRLHQQFLEEHGKGLESQILAWKKFRSQYLSDPGNIDPAYLQERLEPLRSNRKTSSIAETENAVMELKASLSKTFQRSFSGENSLLEVFKKLVEMNQIQLAMTLARDFKLSQALVWSATVQVYCRTHRFERLDRFIEKNAITGKKAPIDFRIIAETCMAYEAPRHMISRFIDKCTELTYQERIELFVKNHDYQKAAEEAFQQKDKDSLDKLLQASENENDSSMVNSYLNRLG